MMKTTQTWLLLLVFVVVLDTIICPPVKVKKSENKTDDEEKTDEDVNFGLEYERYLKEVVGVLESDEIFKKKLQESNVSEIKSGEIARHLEFVSHNIRTRLDEIKRKEIDRLRQVLKIQQQIKRGENDPDFQMVNKNRVLAHVDHKNPNTFEVEDLAKLIKRASQDLEDIDKQRRDEFKRYELEKEAEKQDKLSHMDEEHRKEEVIKLEEMKKKHADHPKIHHPISKDQLEEVWEESDGMEKDDFDPRTFFVLHDQNGDMMLDEAEVEALFQKELDKVYDPNNPEDDLIERYEEMNRMREHVFNEVDKNGDKLISLDEFLKSTNREDFGKDEGWDTLDEQKVYTDEELERFVREYEDRERLELEKQGHAPPMDPSHQAPIVRDNFGQVQHDQGQGQQIHMEQRPPGDGQPIYNQHGGNAPSQDVHFEPYQQHIEKQQLHVEPPEHIAQHQREQPHIEPVQHVQHPPREYIEVHQQEQQHIDPPQNAHLPPEQPQQHIESQHFEQQHQANLDQAVNDHVPQQQQQQHVDQPIVDHIQQQQQHVDQPIVDHIQQQQHVDQPIVDHIQQQQQQHVDQPIVDHIQQQHVDQPIVDHIQQQQQHVDHIQHQQQEQPQQQHHPEQ